MALSRICEIEIDSAYRRSGSNSASDFEFQLPYSFPNYKNSQIQLGYAFVPNTWWNIFQTQTLNLQGTISGVPFNVNISVPPGSYTAASIAQAFTSGFLVATNVYLQNSVPINSFTSAPNLVGAVVIVWSGTTKRIVIANNTGSALTITGAQALSLLGFSSSTIVIPAVTTVGTGSVQSDISPALLSDRDQRFYIRIKGFENKIMLPQLSQQYFTFALNLKDTGAGLGYVTIPQDDQEQTMILSDNHIRSNTTLSIQLVDSYGNLVDLNGRDWKFVLRVEPINYENMMIPMLQ